MKFRIVILMLAVAAIFAVWGCSNDKPTSSNNPGDTTSTNTTDWNTAGYWDARDINASDYENYIFYSFEKKDTVNLTLDQALTSTNWDIGFKRVTLLINSGASGAGNTKVVDLASINHIDSTNFEGFTDYSVIDTNQLGSGSYTLNIDEWYIYNPSNHTVNPTQNVYLLHDATDGYVKFQVIGIDNPGRYNMGTITIQYIYSTTTSFDGQPDTLAFTDSTGGAFYVDFSTGSIVVPSIPRSSTDWDIEINGFEIHQNNTIFGIGAAGSYEVWLDQTNPADFNETTSVPNGVPFFSDEYGSPMTDWYNYIHPPGGNPTILSKNHVYLFKSGEHFYKMQISAYYNHDNMASGYYSFKWLGF